MSAPFDPSKLNFDINTDDSISQDPVIKQKNESLETTDILSEINTTSSQVNTQKNDTKKINLNSSQKEDPSIKEINLEKKSVIGKSNSNNEEDSKKVGKNETGSNKEKNKTQDPLKKNDILTESSETKEKIVEKQKIVDINLSTLENIVTLIDEKKYEFVLIEPEDALVKVTFRQDNIDKDTRYIKYPIVHYVQIGRASCSGR